VRLDDAGPRTWLLATVAGWAVFAWLLAVFGMGRHAQALEADPGLLRPLPNARPAAAQRLGPMSQYAAIAQRPLFSQDRLPKAFFLQGAGEGESQQAAFDYVLTSVLITPTLKMAILQPADGSESVRVKLGEVPESHPAWRLTSLDARSAVFEGPEGRREMTLRVFDGQGGQPPTAVGTASGANRPQPVGVPVQPPAPNAAAAGNRPANGNANARPAGSNAPNRSANNNQPTTPTPPEPEPSENTPMTPEAQMEAIRKRIEARRAQMRQQQSAQPPAQTP